MLGSRPSFQSALFRIIFALQKNACSVDGWVNLTMRRTCTIIKLLQHIVEVHGPTHLLGTGPDVRKVSPSEPKTAGFLWATLALCHILWNISRRLTLRIGSGWDSVVVMAGRVTMHNGFLKGDSNSFLRSLHFQ
jgi:hypothetical protein